MYLKRQGFLVYDHLYPFREAAKFILNAEHHSVQTRSNINMEHFAHSLSSFTDNMVRPLPFQFDRFMDWLQSQRTQIRRIVVVVGVSDIESLTLFERRGAMVVRGDVYRIERDARDCPAFD